jgi:hypothetical protein
MELPDGGTGPGSTSGATRTYYSDVVPVLQKNCFPCHSQGGNGQPSLDTYASAAQNAQAILAALKNGTMPPFPPADGCNHYVDELRLSAADQKLIEDWASGGKAQGDPAAAPVYAPPTSTMGTPDRELTAPAHTPTYPGGAGPDDLYWCYPLNPGVSVATDLIGAEVSPGTPNEVHHVIISRDPGGQGTAGQPASGFECNGVPGEMLYAWVPGTRPFQLPAGVGMTLAPSDRLYMQIHYHRSPGVTPSPDTTVTRLYYAKATQAEHAYILWTGNPQFTIPANTIGYTVNSTCTVNDNWKIIGIGPHMHNLGTKFKIGATVSSADQCMMNIPRWDFNWQGGYLLQQPMVMKPGDTIATECVYNNNTNSAVSFGEATGTEMCFGFLAVVAPKKPTFLGPVNFILPDVCAQ